MPRTVPPPRRATLDPRATSLPATGSPCRQRISRAGGARSGTRAVRRPSFVVAAVVSAAILVGCDAKNEAPTSSPPRDPLVEAPSIPAGAPKVAFLGDSIAAGLHLERDHAFPQVLARRSADAGRPFHLVNAGISGDTTSNGLRRVDWLLQQKPDILVIELGGNDGLRGLGLPLIEQNLKAIIQAAKKGGAIPLLLGLRLPPNYGEEYTEGFAALYDRLAKEEQVAYVSFFMKGVAGVPELNLEDGLHPNREGHEKLADTVEPALRELLAKVSTNVEGR